MLLLNFPKEEKSTEASALLMFAISVTERGMVYTFPLYLEFSAMPEARFSASSTMSVNSKSCPDCMYDSD